jgi:signal recognition particle subunit SRP54
MFDGLTERLGRIVGQLGGAARLTPEQVDESLREVRVALLEADVAVPVVKDFIARVRELALAAELGTSLAPGQVVIGLVRQELIALLGDAGAGLRLDVPAPAVILLAGLQGAGKTTTAVKLARWLRESGKRRVLLASCDIYRPAAMEQLAVLAAADGFDVVAPQPGLDAAALATAALKKARATLADVLIVDSAGRLHVDAAMMDEVRALHDVLAPSDTLFVLDSMLGQDALRSARAFDEALPLTGIVLTKIDGDARGGAALSARHVTGKPILFLGSGEKTAEFARFDPERIVSRLLGMGDVQGLVEQVRRGADPDKAAGLARKVGKGQGFDLDDFRDQIRQMRGMGGLGSLLEKMPGMPGLPAGVRAQVDDRELVRLEAIINSMTPRERRRPEIINGSRRKRIAAGSGTQVQDVNRLLKQFAQSQKMMKQLAKKGGLANLMRSLGGAMPRGFGR